jgi:hypothetical protein
MSGPPPSEIKYCEKCGISVNQGALYCQRCGEMISRSEAFHPPTGRAAEFLPTYMVTFISIIQATVFVYLLLVAKDQYSSILAGTYSPFWTVLIVGMFLMIAALWMNYTHYYTSLRLKPTSLDALLPFCFGATQAIAIFSISLQQLSVFYFAMAANAMVAIIQTYVTIRQARLHQEYEENRAFIEYTSKHRMLRRWYAMRLLVSSSLGLRKHCSICTRS